jgi:hypothetical protein
VEGESLASADSQGAGGSRPPSLTAPEPFLADYSTAVLAAVLEDADARWHLTCMNQYQIRTGGCCHGEVCMKKFVWPLIVVLLMLVVMGTADYVKIANQRDRLLGQLEEAAAVASTFPPDSPEALAAKERGTMIAFAWPCYWWEDGQAVKSRAVEVFQNLIAQKRQINPQPEPDKKPDQSAGSQ